MQPVYGHDAWAALMFSAVRPPAMKMTAIIPLSIFPMMCDSPVVQTVIVRM